MSGRMISLSEDYLIPADAYKVLQSAAKMAYGSGKGSWSWLEGMKGGFGYVGMKENGQVVKFKTHQSERLFKFATEEEIAESNKLRIALIKALDSIKVRERVITCEEGPKSINEADPERRSGSLVGSDDELKEMIHSIEGLLGVKYEKKNTTIGPNGSISVKKAWESTTKSLLKRSVVAQVLTKLSSVIGDGDTEGEWLGLDDARLSRLSQEENSATSKAMDAKIQSIIENAGGKAIGKSIDKVTDAKIKLASKYDKFCMVVKRLKEDEHKHRVRNIPAVQSFLNCFQNVQVTHLMNEFDKWVNGEEEEAINEKEKVLDAAYAALLNLDGEAS